MIQRIQTLYLFTCGVCFSLLLVLPISTIIVNDSILIIKLVSIKKITGEKIEVINGPLILPIIISLCIIIVSIFTIFIYKKRKLQKMLCNFLMLLISFFLVLEFFAIQSIPYIQTAETELSIGAFLPILSIVFVFFAQIAIRKDEKLVKSADRLR